MLCETMKFSQGAGPDMVIHAVSRYTHGPDIPQFSTEAKLTRAQYTKN